MTTNEKQNKQPTSGFNTDLPTPEQNGIVADKHDAYIQEEMKRKLQNKMRLLQDFAFELDGEEISEEAEPQVTVYADERPRYAGRVSGNTFRSLTDAYADINRQIGSFYTDTSAEDEEWQSEMQARIEELERRLEEERERKTAQEKQVALLEKSYEIAARYMNGGQTEQPAAAAAAQPSTVTDEVVVQPVKQVRRNIVSLLAAPMPDSVFREEFTKPRNWGFNTVGAEEHEEERNSIRVCVYRTVTITDGGEVSLRLTEPMMAGNTLIPVGTVVTGTAGLEVTYDKTVHIIFPAAVRYVDLGLPNLIAGKVDGAENVIRVKATVRDFRVETNMSVITEDGSFYTFNVRYAAEPLLLNVEMCDFIHDGESANRPNNAMEVYLTELGSESPLLVRLIMKSIHKQDRSEVKHIGCKCFGIQYLLKGIYTHNGLLYFHMQLKDSSNVPFDVDFITFKIVDKKVAKRTAMQEQVIFPLRAYNYATRVARKRDERTVFTFDKFIIPDDKCFVVELNEKNGGRHQSFTVENEDLVRARVIDELKVQ